MQMGKKITAYILLTALFVTAVPGITADAFAAASVQAVDVEESANTVELIESASENAESVEAVEEVSENAELLAASKADIKNPRIVADSSMEAGQKVTYDCVWFGSYPQTELVLSGSAEETALKEMNTYYTTEYESISSSDYSKLANATYTSNGDATVSLSSGAVKVRRIKKSDVTYTSSESNYYNWSYSTSYHYFRYDPIRWRVLSVDSNGYALVRAEKVLDAQEYDEKYINTTWEISNIRSWLNSNTDGFYKNAFNDTEMSAIKNSFVENKDNISFGTEGGNDTYDKVFLLSESEVYNTDTAASYGFVKDGATCDEARRIQPSTYAYAMGTWRDRYLSCTGNSCWWLRSPGSHTGDAAYVRCDGYVYYYGGNAYNYDYAVCPALNLNLSSSVVTYAGVVCTDGTQTEVGDGGSTPAPAHTKTEDIHFIIKENTKLSAEDMEYVLSKDSEVTYQSNTKNTDKNGAVIFNVEKEKESVTIKKSGYIERTVNEERLKESKTIYLQKEEKVRPVISAVWADNKDCMNESVYVPLTSEDTRNFEVEVSWGSGGRGSLAFTQNGRSVTFEEDSFSMVLKDKFDVSSTIYVIATDAKGVSTKRELKFTSVPENGIVKTLNEGKFSITDTSLTVPDTAPFPFAGSKLKMKLKSPIDSSAYIEDGKLYVALGYTFDEDETLEGGKNSKDGWVKKDKEDKGKIKEFVDNMKDIRYSTNKEAIKKKVTRAYNKHKNNVAEHKGSIGFDGKVKIMGFVEFDISGSEWKMLDSGVVMVVSGKAEYSKPFMAGPVPMFFVGSLSSEAEGKFNLLINEAAKEMTPGGEIDWDLIKIKLGLGAGMKDVLYADGGVEGGINWKWIIKSDEKDYHKLTAFGKLWANIGFLWWSWSPDLKDTKIEGVLYETNSSNLNTAGTLDGWDIFNTGISNLSNYELNDISYISVKNTTSPRDLLRQGSTGNENPLSVIIKENIYRESDIEYLQLSDGRYMGFFINSEDDDYNHIGLYYTIYDGTNWTEPKPVEDDGTTDYMPRAVVYGNTVYVTWMNARKSFEVNDALNINDIVEEFNISVARFDGEDFEVQDFYIDGLNMMPDISVNNDKATVAWLNSKDGDLFGGAYDIYTVSYDNGWGNPNKKYTVSSEINRLRVNTKPDGSYDIAYSIEHTNDNNEEQSVIYENGNAITSTDGNALSPVYYDGKLYYWDDGAIKNSFNDNAVGSIPVADYKLVSVDNSLVAVYEDLDEFNTSLYASIYDEETNKWRPGVALLSDENTVNAWGAIGCSDGNIDLLYSSKEVSVVEEKVEYGKANLVHKSYNRDTRVLISDVLCDEESFKLGLDMPVYVTIKNDGIESASGLKIVVEDKSGNKINETLVSDSILSGETAEETLSINVSDVDAMSQIRISVMSDENVLDTHTESVNYEDLAIDSISYGVAGDGNFIITADIINQGNNKMAPADISLRYGSRDGELVSKVTTPEIDFNDLYLANFVLDEYKQGAYYVCIDNEDSNVGNDSDFVIVNETTLDTDIVYTDDIKIDDSYPNSMRPSIIGADIKYNTSYAYTGKEIYPKINLKVGKTTLVEGIDYTVGYKNNVNASSDSGVAKIIVNGNGLYKGNRTYEFVITPKSVKKLKVYADTIEDIENDSYNKVHVFDGNKPLIRGEDYEIKLWMTSFSPKKAVAQITGKGNYTDWMEVKLPVITLKDSEKLITSAEYKNAGEEKNRYTGKALKYTADDFVVKTANEEVVPTTDYTVSVKNTKDAGYGMATIKGKGKVFKGSVNVPVKIYPTQTVFDATVKSSVVYNGKLQRQKPKVKSALGNLKEGKDYTIVYKNNLYAGEASVEITGIGNYEGQSLTKTFTINPLDIKKTSIKKDKNGNVTITYNKHQLVEGIDYSVTDTTNKGKPAKLITGKKNFTGSVVK